MKRVELSLLLAGDSNFLISHQRDETTFCGSSLAVEFGRFANMLNVSAKIFNSSKWGSTLMDYYMSSVVNGPFMHWDCEVMVIGFGTNDCNYYYSINSHVISPRLHKQILDDLINVIFQATSVKRIILLPVPPVRLPHDVNRNYLMNGVIRSYNRVRAEVAKEYKSKVYYLSNLSYGINHLCPDGYHLNIDGITLLARCLSNHLLELSI